MAEAILLVDDDEIFLDVMSRAFTKRGYRAFTAANLAQVDGHLQQQAFPYAVIDLKIANESGFDCLQRVLAANAATKALILTGYSSIATAVAAIKAGAFDYACKPLDADEILRIMDPSVMKTPVPEDDPPSVERLQWEHIQRVLESHDGNISATARSLGMHRRTLQRKLQKRPVRR